MAALSSITRSRVLGSIVGLFMCCILDDWQLEREGCAFTEAIAVGDESSAHFFGRERTAVQTEAVAVFLRREAVRENLREILRRDADTVVDHTELDAIVSVHADAQNEA